MGAAAVLEDEVQVVIAADDDELYRVRRDVAKELRRTRKLPIAVLDQDEGDEEPLPVAERLDLARRADLVLVLLGSGYGEPPPGTQRSLPHLQYDVALASPHMALVCSEIASAAAPSSALIDWEERIERRVRIDRRHAIDPQLADGVAHLVRDAAHHRLVALGLVGEPGSPTAEPLLWVPDEVWEVVGRRRRPDRVGPRLGLLGPQRPVARIDSTAEPEREPAQIAGDEQWNEAVVAWDSELWGAFADHLAAAHGHRPLDADAALFLARVRSASCRVDRAESALVLARDVAALAELRDEPALASSALLVAARAARVAGADSVEHAQRAHELVPHRAEPLVELAVEAARTEDWDRFSEQAWAATLRYPEAILHLAAHPALAAHPNQLHGVVEELRERVVEQLRPVAEVGRRHLPPGPLAADLRPEDVDAGIRRLVEIGADTVEHLHGQLRRLADEVQTAHDRYTALRGDAPPRDKLGPSPDAVIAKDPTPVLAAALVGGFVAALTTGQLGGPWWAHFLAGFTLVQFAEWSWRRRRQADYEVREAAARAADEEEQVVLQQAIQEAHQAREFAVTRFQRAVEDVERNALHWWCLLPTVEPDRAEPGDLVRVRRSDQPAGAIVDLALFPRDLRNVITADEVHGDHVLCRVVDRREDGVLELSRRLAYFDG
ncbi:MAG: hypothetical protein AAGF02_05910 [Actinomycetota bacterium]